jgi:hypothetical protein
MALPKPVDWDQLYPGRFLKAGEFLGRKVTLTIADVILDELEGEKGKEVKGCISFKETEKQIPVNKTNGICIKAMFGRKIPDWIGKRITLYPGTVESGGMKGEPAIRVWGSPDIAHDFDVSVQLPKKKAFSVTLHKTTKEKTAPAGAREPGSDG